MVHQGLDLAPEEGLSDTLLYRDKLLAPTLFLLHNKNPDNVGVLTCSGGGASRYASLSG